MTTRNALPTTLAALALAAGLATPAVTAASREPLSRPAVPANLEVDAGFRPYLLGHASGTQNYTCVPSGAGVAWVLFGPQATLYDADLEQITTHYLSPNPVESGTPRATWQSSRDSSTVWALAEQSSTDAAYVAPGAVAWLKLRVVGAQFGPDGGGKLARTTYIQRVNTAGGVAPSTGCASGADISRRAFVPYTTDYVFYR